MRNTSCHIQKYSTGQEHLFDFSLASTDEDN